MEPNANFQIGIPLFCLTLTFLFWQLIGLLDIEVSRIQKYMATFRCDIWNRLVIKHEK